MNLNAFFYFSRKRMEQDPKEERKVHPTQIIQESRTLSLFVELEKI